MLHVLHLLRISIEIETFLMTQPQPYSLLEFSRFTQSCQCWHFSMLKSKNEFDIVVNRINFNSIRHGNFHFILNLIKLLSFSILFSIKTIQKMPTLPTLWENSIVMVEE